MGDVHLVLAALSILDAANLREEVTDVEDLPLSIVGDGTAVLASVVFLTWRAFVLERVSNHDASIRVCCRPFIGHDRAFKLDLNGLPFPVKLYVCYVVSINSQILLSHLLCVHCLLVSVCISWETSSTTSALIHSFVFNVIYFKAKLCCISPWCTTFL